MVKCVSIFSGAGGLDIGAINAGVEVISCIEHDSDAVKTLRLNHTLFSGDVFEADIQDIGFDQWRSAEETILVGGPPCQPFSKNGYWVKNDNRLIQNDPRNMLGQYIRTISELNPNGFLFENVESILHPTNRETFTKFVDEAKTLGYACTVFKTNSADFGVPQKRKRVFVFGIRGGKSTIPFPIATHSDPTKKSYDETLLPYLGVGQFIKKFSGKKFAEPQEDASNGTYYNELTHVPAGRNYMALSSLENYEGRSFRSGGRFWNFLYKLHLDLPSITIAAQPGPWVGPFHWDSRRLRVPEIAAIQMFPENYKFYGTRRSIQKQIGNAVPCLLGEKMVKHLVEHLE